MSRKKVKEKGISEIIKESEEEIFRFLDDQDVQKMMEFYRGYFWALIDIESANRSKYVLRDSVKETIEMLVRDIIRTYLYKKHNIYDIFNESED